MSPSPLLLIPPRGISGVSEEEDEKEEEEEEEWRKGQEEPERQPRGEE